LYPIAVNLNGKHCVVVGGGRVAERRIAGLREQGAQVTLIAPEATPILQALAEAGTVHWNRADYRSELLQGAFLVIAATDKRDVNAAVARDAQERGLLVCCADGYEDGNFTTPGVIRRGDLTLTVTTGGQSPTLTALLRERLSAEFGPEWEALTALLGRLRSDIQRTGDEAARRVAVQRVLDDNPIRQCLLQGDSAGAEAHARTILQT
jgi:precorrin-2 dehydrogenase/sirohydrochlorin ferrochelatase